MPLTTRKRKNPPDATRKEVAVLRARVKKLEQDVRALYRVVPGLNALATTNYDKLKKLDQQVRQTPTRSRVTSSPKHSPFDPSASVVRPKHLQEAVGVSTTTAWRLRQLGQFPDPIRLSARSVGWRRTDLDQWLVSRGERQQK
jgi:prophage regulatory protein